MCEFHCDIDREEDSQLFHALQTILDAISCKRPMRKSTSGRFS